MPPSSRDAYARGNLKINSDNVAWAAENNTTATTNPDADTDTPGTTQTATSSPVAHEANSTTTRSKNCVTATSVDLGAETVKDQLFR